MARKNNRWDTHQSLGYLSEPRVHIHQPLPTAQGHICLSCGQRLGTHELPALVR